MSKSNRYASRRQQFVPASYSIEELESKLLLAGNVTVALSGQNLLVRGDNLDNTVEITVLGGNAVVRGLDDTTINGGTELFEVVSGDNTVNGTLSVQMANGNDTVLFSRNIEFIGPAVVQGHEGDDNIGSTGARFRNNLFIFGHGGDDTISLQDTQVSGAVFIRGKSGDDTVSFEDSVFDDRVKILTDFGDDCVILERTDIAGKLSIFTSVGEDDVSIANSQVFGQTHIMTASSSDFVNFDSNRFGSNLIINLGSSDDAMLVQNDNVFDGILGITGGDGNADTVEIQDTNTFNKFQFAIKTEFSSIAIGAINGAPDSADRLDDPATGAIARAQTANDLFTNLLVTNTQDLVIDTSGQTGVVQSNGTLITKDDTFEISGTTTPNSTVEIDSDGDGDFDDGTVVADVDGEFSLSAGLTHDETNNGANVINVRSTDETGSEQSEVVNVHFAVGSVVRFESNLGTYDVELLDEDAPNTVDNFKGYFGRYENTIAHRSPPNFVVQSGGFVAENGTVTAIVTDPPIQNEAAAADNNNERGTLSMAQLGGDINSGTSQWFFNVVDNLQLDNVPHTVFGRVIGLGMDIIDAINDLPIFNVNSFFGQSALGETPLLGYEEFTMDLTGTVTVSPGSSLVTGTGTLFTQELADTQGGGGLQARIRIDGQEFDVVAINSDTSLTLSAVHTTGATDVVAEGNEQPGDAQFIRYSSIGEILDTI